MKPMTSAEYCEKRGVACPNCRSIDEISGGFVEIQENRAYQNIQCGDCGAEWTDHHQLSGYSELVLPDDKESK